MLAALRKVESRGAIETAHRAKQTAGQVFRYVVVTGRAESDPSRDLKGALQKPNEKHHAAITNPPQVANLLLSMDAFEGTPTVKAALQLSALLFQRPGEIRAMEWTEINWEVEQWEIPDEKMKMGEPHIVPLSSQAGGAMYSRAPGGLVVVCRTMPYGSPCALWATITTP